MRRCIGLVIFALLIAAACGSGSDPGPDGSAAADPTAEPGETPISPTSPPASTPPTATPEAQAALVLAPTTTGRAAVVAGAPVTELADSVNRGGFALWASVAAEENFVFSPTSIIHTLLMARAAADDATGEAIDDALGWPLGVETHDAWNAVAQTMAAAAADQDELTVAIADAIFPSLDTQPDQAWVDLLATHHGAQVEALDLAGDSEGSRRHINGWISDRTAGLIPELLPEGFIQPNTVLVLADALHFEARWQLVFGKYGPESGAFTRLDGSASDVEFMVERELASARGTGDGFGAVEIPYVGGEFSMLVVVPDVGRFVETRGRLFAGGLVDEVEAVLETGPFELWLPRWETTSELDLVDWLESVGAAPGAYPSISPGAFLDAAVHAADIAVDEWGTVAAAATAFGFDSSGADSADLVIKADKPFLYLIRHSESGLVLFAGQVTDPTR